MENIIWVVLLCAVLALLFAAWKTSAVSKADAGTERMKEIAGNISDGARAFLFAEYKILVIFVAVLFVLIGLFITWLTAGCFLIGAVFSVCAGYVGMNVATKANVRTAAAAKSSGMNKALGVAFSGGSGKSHIDSPVTLTVADGKAVATVVWSSSKYDYMIVDGERYDVLTTEPGSTFEIPVAAFDTDLTVIGDTTAMSTPHEIEYTLNFSSESLTSAG